MYIILLDKILICSLSFFLDKFDWRLVLYILQCFTDFILSISFRLLVAFIFVGRSLLLSFFILTSILLLLAILLVLLCYLVRIVLGRNDILILQTWLLNLPFFVLRPLLLFILVLVFDVHLIFGGNLELSLLIRILWWLYLFALGTFFLLFFWSFF